MSNLVKRLFIVVIILSLMPVSFQLAFAVKDEEYESSSDTYELSTDPVFADARKSFEKAMYYMEKGDSDFRRRVGQAQKMYEHAEDYLSKAAFIFKEIGAVEGIDTTHEVSVCDMIQREAHVLVNKCRKTARHR